MKIEQVLEKLGIDVSSEDVRSGEWKFPGAVETTHRMPGVGEEPIAWFADDEVDEEPTQHPILINVMEAIGNGDGQFSVVIERDIDSEDFLRYGGVLQLIHMETREMELVPGRIEYYASYAFNLVAEFQFFSTVHHERLVTPDPGFTLSVRRPWDTDVRDGLWSQEEAHLWAVGIERDRRRQDAADWLDYQQNMDS
tara:strand:+ start:1404 stop:1991 length:588 start_codon:yes stop_codon:yes gene_type:complete